MKKIIILEVLGLMLVSVALGLMLMSISVEAREIKNCIINPVDTVDQICTVLPADVQIVPNVDPLEDPEPVVTPTRHNRVGSVMPLPTFTNTVYVWDVVKLGDKGQDVKDFQTYLNNKGANLKVDGIYGPLTLDAWNKIK